MNKQQYALVTRALVIIRIESFENRNYNEKAALSFLKKKIDIVLGLRSGVFVLPLYLLESS